MFNQNQNTHTYTHTHTHTHHATDSTHQLGGTIDVALSHQDLPHLMRSNGWCWTIRSPSVGMVSRHAPPALLYRHHLDFRSPVAAWLQLNIDLLMGSSLQSSPICHHSEWPVDWYRLVSSIRWYQWLYCRRIRRRRRRATYHMMFDQTDPWFDSECRDAKRLTRQANSVVSFSSARALRCHTLFTHRDISITRHGDIVGRDRMAWPAPIATQQLLQSRIEADRTSPKRLWSSVDTLLRLPLSLSVFKSSVATYMKKCTASVCRSTECSLYQAVPQSFSWSSVRITIRIFQRGRYFARPVRHSRGLRWRRGDRNLALFDLSAAFNTVDHAILFKRLHHSYGFDDTVLDWFESYHCGRRQSVRCDYKANSAFIMATCGIPQASVLGQILIIIYTQDYWAPRSVTAKLQQCIRHYYLNTLLFHR